MVIGLRIEKELLILMEGRVYLYLYLCAYLYHTSYLSIIIKHSFNKASWDEENELLNDVMVPDLIKCLDMLGDKVKVLK